MLEFIDADFLFYVHFILVTLASMDNDELSQAWGISNGFLVVLLFYITIEDTGSVSRAKAQNLLLYVYFFTIFTDMLLFLTFGSDNQSDSNEQWSLAASIFNLIAKMIFATILILKKMGGDEMFKATSKTERKGYGGTGHTDSLMENQYQHQDEVH